MGSQHYWRDCNHLVSAEGKLLSWLLGRCLGCSAPLLFSSPSSATIASAPTRCFIRMYGFQTQVHELFPPMSAMRGNAFPHCTLTHLWYTSPIYTHILFYGTQARCRQNLCLLRVRPNDSVQHGYLTCHPTRHLYMEALQPFEDDGVCVCV